MAECVSCAARSGDATFPEHRKRREPCMCTDCIAERDKLDRTSGRRKEAMTRASYRARLRARQAKPQLDLVDMIVRAP